MSLALLHSGDAMVFRQLFDLSSSTYTYLLADEAERVGVLIDPVVELVDRDLLLARELELRLLYVMDTHVHADHVTGAAAVRERTGAKTVSGTKGAPAADVHVHEGDVLHVGSIALEVLATPGHTDDSVSYLMNDRVFTGDALFIRGCGRTDFQNGDPHQLYTSLTKVLFLLPEPTLVYPAHDYHGQTVSTIGEEKRLNPRVSGKSEDEFVGIMQNLRLPPPPRLAEIVPLNRACGVAAVRHG